MKLKDFLETIDSNTRVSICSDLGPIVDAKSAVEIPAISVIYYLNAPVSRIYYDKDDDSITLELDENFTN